MSVGTLDPVEEPLKIQVVAVNLLLSQLGFEISLRSCLASFRIAQEFKPQPGPDWPGILGDGVLTMRVSSPQSASRTGLAPRESAVVGAGLDFSDDVSTWRWGTTSC